MSTATQLAVTVADQEFFNDLKVGQVISCPAHRTITLEDTFNYSRRSGDGNPIHFNERFAKAQGLQKCIAAGLLVLELASGLAWIAGGIARNLVVFERLGTWMFNKPVEVGDTIQVEIEVGSLKPYPRQKLGRAGLMVTVINQRGETVQNGTWEVLVKMRDYDKALAQRLAKSTSTQLNELAAVAASQTDNLQVTAPAA